MGYHDYTLYPIYIQLDRGDLNIIKIAVNMGMLRHLKLKSLVRG